MNIEMELERQLKNLFEKRSRSAISAMEIKSWLNDYLACRSSETSAFPEEASKPHWDMLVADSHYSSPAGFVLAFFHKDEVKFLFGVGDAHRVKAFCTNEFPDDPTLIVDEAKSRFSVLGNEVVCSIETLKEWLEENG
jgi:hypothetical protein